MNKINPNLLDLQHLLMNWGGQAWYYNANYEMEYVPQLNPGQIFVSYFCNYALTNGEMKNLLNDVVGANAFTYPLEWGSSTVVQLCSLNTLAGSPFTQQQLVYLWTNFLTTIYNLFKYSIPYAQQNDNVRVTLSMLYPGYTSNNGFAMIQSNSYLPNQTLQSMDAYFGLYAQDIFQYFLRITVQLRQWTMVQSKYTITHTRTEGINEQTGSNTTNQTSGVSQTSFNPVQTNSNINIPTISVGTTQIPDGTNNTIPTGQTVINENTASYNAHGSGSNNNFMENQQRSINESYQTQDLNAYKNIGMQDVTQALKPLIYKISTLFWTLGNDEFPANSMWGFNIW